MTISSLIVRLLTTLNMEVKTIITRNIPIVAIRGSVVFPHTDTLLSFGRPKSVSAVNTAFQEDRVIAIFTQKDPRMTDPQEEDLYQIGTIATITQMMSTEGEIHTLIRGQARIKLEEIFSHEPHLLGRVTELVEEKNESAQIKALANELLELFKKAVNMGKQAEVMTVMKLVSGQASPTELADQIASMLEIKVIEKQKLLETLVLKNRLEKVVKLLAHEISVLDLERTIAVKTQRRFEGQMRKAMLREKKRTIEEELCEDEDSDLSSEEMMEYKQKIKEAKMPEDVKKRAEKELKRLSQMAPHNPEGAYVRNYLDWLVEMPWNKSTPNNVSIEKATKILADRHYGMEKAKERIVEFLAVMKIKGTAKKKGKSAESQPTILCFIGPPEVGKTSIGKSIAEA